jgi:hypothetical protein
MTERDMKQRHGDEEKLARTGDSRMQYDEFTRKQNEREGGGPSPYDQARPGMPDDRVITKGERERPGPTSGELDTASDDELLQTTQVDQGRPLGQGPYGATQRAGGVDGQELSDDINRQEERRSFDEAVRQDVSTGAVPPAEGGKKPRRKKTA